MKERVLVKLDELEQLMTELTSILPEDYQEYANSLVHRRATERIIQMCVECMLDICAMIVKERRLGVPSSDADMFIRLEKNNVFEPELIETLRDMRRFRNRIVHPYSDLDPQSVHELAGQLMEDLKSFNTAVREFLRKE